MMLHTIRKKTLYDSVFFSVQVIRFCWYFNSYTEHIQTLMMRNENNYFSIFMAVRYSFIHFKVCTFQEVYSICCSLKISSKDFKYSSKLTVPKSLPYILYTTTESSEISQYLEKTHLRLVLVIFIAVLMW